MIGAGNTAEDRYLRVLAAIILIFATWHAVRFADQPLVEFEAWRQTQTAISAYWMSEEGWRIAYQTPVLGYPWEIPLTAPIFESITVFVAWITRIPLDPAGRLVSFAFLLACLFPARTIFRKLHVPNEAFWIFASLLIASPIYLFFGRNFLIETAALFFTLVAVRHAIDLMEEKPSLGSSLLFALFASLGMLQKASTALGPILVLFVIVAWTHLRRRRFRVPPLDVIVKIGVAFAIPALATIAWFAYAGEIKKRNEMMSSIHSNERMFRDWVLANNRLRFDPSVWRMILWDRVIVGSAAGFLGLLALIGGALVGGPKTRGIIAAGFALFAAPAVISITHHHFLPYYQTANAVYIIAVVSICLAAVLRWWNAKAVAAALVCAVFVAFSLYSYKKDYWRYTSKQLTEATSSTLAVSDVIRRYTPDDSGIVVFGLVSTGSIQPYEGWSGEIQYYSRRKGLTVDGNKRRFERAKLAPQSYLGGMELGAIVSGKQEYYDDLMEAFETNEAVQGMFVYEVKGVLVWLNNGEGIELADGERIPPLGRVPAAEPRE